MTSKNSLCKKSLLLDNLKRHAWLAAIYSVILFFALPVSALLNAQRITRHYITSMDIDSIKTIISETFSNGGIIFLAVPAAVLAAAAMFHYINSKKQTDFYHSLPIKRTRLFFNNIAVGFASFIVPYLIFMLIAALAYLMNGLGTYMSASIIMRSIGVEVLSFSVTFFLSLFSFMLCGNVIVGLLGFGVLTFYAPSLLGIIFTYMTAFFSTFYEAVFNFENILTHSSPVVYLAFKSPSSYTAGRVIFYIIFALALAALSLILYLKRGSEAAGKAIAFKTAKPIIKYPIVFLATCTFGLLFRSMGDDSIGWMIFGFLCGAALSHAVIEIIYELDFKALFKNLTPMAVFCGVFAVLYLFFETDLMGYDSYLPDSSKVESVSVNLSYKYDYHSGRFFDYDGREKRQLERMTFSTDGQIASVLAMARDSIEESENGGRDYSENTYEWLGVGYNLKNGRTVYRSYYVKSEVFNSYLKQLYDSEGFKERYFDMIYFKNNPQGFDYKPQSVQCTDLLSNESTSVENAAFSNELSDAVCSDILQASSEYIDRELPIFLLHFDMIKSAPDGISSYSTRLYMPVYGCFERTLTLLAQQGITSAGESYIADLSGVDNASVTLRSSGLTMEISSPEQIKALAPYLIPSIAVDYDLFGNENEKTSMRYSVYVTNEDHTISSNYYFKNDTPPAFVAQYFLDNAENSEQNGGGNYMPGAMESFTSIPSTHVVYPEDDYVGYGSEIVY